MAKNRCAGSNFVCPPSHSMWGVLRTILGLGEWFNKSCWGERKLQVGGGAAGLGGCGGLSAVDSCRAGEVVARGRVTARVRMVNHEVHGEIVT